MPKRALPGRLATLCSIAFVLLTQATINARRDLHEGTIRSSISLLSAGDCSPSEVHLSLAEAERSVRVSWRTRGEGCASTVSYGRFDKKNGVHLAGAPMLQSDGSSYTISEDLMCDAPAKKKPFTVHMHTAVMYDLEPNTDYWYHMLDDDQAGRTFSFRSPRVVGADQPFSFIAFGDMGESRTRSRKSPMGAATVDAIGREIDRQPVDLILHVGDLAYADGRYKVWDEFMNQIEPLASRVPYMVGIGNHEAGPCGSRADHENDPSGEGPYNPDWGNYGPESGGECGAMTAHRFLMPGSDLQTRRGAFAAAAAAAAAGETTVPGDAASRRRLAMMSNGGGSGSGTVTAARAEIRVQEEEVLVGEDGERLVVVHAADDSEEGAGQPRDAKATGADAAVEAVDNIVAEAAVGRDRRRNGDAGASNPPFWYSFEYGTVHFTVLSSEHNLEEGSTQRDWLEADLAGVDRCRTPWVVVGMHRPMYVVYPHKDNRVVGEHIRAAIEDLLLGHRVDLVVSGHVHAYYRSCRVAGGRCVEEGDEGEGEGMTHLVIGTAGHVLSAVEDDQKEWCDQVFNNHGFGRFDVDGDRLRFSFIRSEDGSEADVLTLRSKVAPGDACSGSGASSRASSKASDSSR